MTDDGTGDGVSIPSVFISQENGAILKQAVTNGEKVMVQLKWNVPHPDNHVEWELWTSSNNMDASGFEKGFVQPALALGKSVSFSPHYATLDGRYFLCTLPGYRYDAQCSTL